MSTRLQSRQLSLSPVGFLKHSLSFSSCVPCSQKPGSAPSGSGALIPRTPACIPFPVALPYFGYPSLLYGWIHKWCWELLFQRSPFYCFPILHLKLEGIPIYWGPFRSNLSLSIKNWLDNLDSWLLYINISFPVYSSHFFIECFCFLLFASFYVSAFLLMKWLLSKPSSCSSLRPPYICLTVLIIVNIIKINNASLVIFIGHLLCFLISLQLFVCFIFTVLIYHSKIHAFPCVF